MTMNDEALFRYDGEYDERTGNIEVGETIRMTGLEIHPVKDDSVSGQGGGRMVVKVKTSRGKLIPNDATMIWRGTEWEPLKNAAYHAQKLDSQRHWRSMRYISMGVVADG